MFSLSKEGELRVAAGSKLPGTIRGSLSRKAGNGKKVAMRNTMKNFMLGTALVAGLLGTGAVNATAQEYRDGGHRGFGSARGGEAFEHRDGDRRDFDRRDFRRPIGGPVYGGGYRGGYVGGGVALGYDAYIPPCPGDGYTWTAGYYNGGIWVPGAWVIRGGYRGVDRGYVGGYAYGRQGWDDHRGREFEHGYDRGGRDRDGRGGEFRGRR